MIITKKTLLIAVISTLILSLGLSGCGDAPQSGARKKQPHLVEVRQAEIKAVRTQLAASGSLQAERRVRIYNQLSARILEITVRPGDPVSTGDPLVQLDDSIIVAEYDKAVAQQKQAQDDFDRLQQLKPKKLASEEEVARARTELEVATAEVKLQRTRLAQTVIKAPFSGVVTERNAEPGDVVALHSHILSIIDPDTLHLVARVAEQWLPRIAVGDHVSITIDALGPMQHDGSITRIYPAIDTSTRKGTIEIGFEPQPLGVQSGQLARAEFYTHSVDRLVIPASSLHHDSNGAYVYTVDDDSKTTRVHVSQGHQYDDELAINAGLDVNSRVVSKGFIGLRDGKSVKVVNTQPGATAEAAKQ